MSTVKNQIGIGKVFRTIDGMQVLKNIIRDICRHKYIYIMLIPIVAYYILFHYMPMYGATIAFKDYSIGQSIWSSPWTGFKHFADFFGSYYFERILRNTIVLSVSNLLFSFPAPIILAILINEVKGKIFKHTVQTVSYLPYFISVVVVAGIIFDFFSRDGLVNNIINVFGTESIPFLLKPEWFPVLYVGSNIWQFTGWTSIIYLAAISGIEQEMYEAAIMDGAGRLRQIWHITLPSLMPTIVIMLILALGSIMSVSYEKIMLLYTPITYETADVIMTYIYRKGVLEMNFSYTAAVGLFNSVINFVLVWASNSVSRRLNENSLW